VLPSGTTASSPWSIQRRRRNQTSAAAVGAGSYMTMQDRNALAIGLQSAPKGAASFTSVSDCQSACDEAQQNCAGFTLLATTDKAKLPATCMIITGDDSVGVFQRSMIRANPGRIGAPSELCPSGFSILPGEASCTPITTAQLVTLVLRAQGTCTPAVVQAARDALRAYFTTSSLAFGVYAPSVSVGAACVVLASGQVSGATCAACFGFCVWFGYEPECCCVPGSRQQHMPLVALPTHHDAGRLWPPPAGRQRDVRGAAHAAGRHDGRARAGDGSSPAGAAGRLWHGPWLVQRPCQRHHYGVNPVDGGVGSPHRRGCVV
jgi:hypothetical protein